MIDEITMEVIRLLIIITILIFSRYLIPLIRSKTKNTQLDSVTNWVYMAVRAAEQTYIGTGRGAERKAIVIEFIKKLLLAHNISISDDQLDTLIEAAVQTINTESGKTTQTDSDNADVETPTIGFTTGEE